MTAPVCDTEPTWYRNADGFPTHKVQIGDNVTVRRMLLNDAELTEVQQAARVEWINDNCVLVEREDGLQRVWIEPKNLRFVSRQPSLTRVESGKAS